MKVRRTAIPAGMALTILVVFSGQGCPPAMADGEFVEGDGITLQDGILSLDTAFTDALYWSVGGNAGTTAGTDFLGTADDEPLEIHVNSTRAMRFEPTDDAPNVIGGFPGNAVTNDAAGGTIAGGGTPGIGDEEPRPNQVFGNHGTVGGGFENAAGVRAFVGGGQSNTARAIRSVICGGSNNTVEQAGDAATIGGGRVNVATRGAATIGGGAFNTAGGEASTIGGGDGNTAAGTSSTVPGGRDNEANSDDSFAAGRRAKANHSGAFVWGDSTNDDVTSFGDDTFSVRAAGGTRFYSSADLGTGVELPAGAGAFANLSDRNAKENFEKVNGRDVLKKLAGMSIETWNYKAQDDTVRHIGPTAQDFRTAFRLGNDDKRIMTVDADGVALAAIQGLNELLEEKERRISQLEERLAELEKRLCTCNE